MKNLVILLSGEINSGKNHAYRVLENKFSDTNKEVHHVFFAQKLKELCEYTFDRYVTHLNETLNSIEAKIESSKVKEELNSLKIAPHNWYEDKTESTRLILQDIGTRFARENVDDEFWPKKVVEQIREKNAPVAIATDFRFPNEFEVLKRELPSELYTLVTLRIERNAGTKEFISNHPSEQALAEFPFDYTIDNTGTLEEFNTNLEKYFNSLQV